MSSPRRPRSHRRSLPTGTHHPAVRSSAHRSDHRRLVRCIVEDPQAIATTGDSAPFIFADMLCLVDDIVPRDAERLLRIAAATEQPQCFCDLIAWARQNGLREAIDAAFDRIVSNSKDSAHRGLTQVLKSRFATSAILGMSPVAVAG